MEDGKEKRLLEKIQNRLSYFLVNEIIKSDPSKVNSQEVFKYKGLNISPVTGYNIDPVDRSIKIQIGGLEAEYKVSTCQKISGGLSRDDEKLINIWLEKKENRFDLKSIFERERLRKRSAIVPFDLEEPFNRGLF